MNTFSEIVEIMDTLSFDEKEELIDILSKRQIDEKRKQLLNEIEQSRKEFKENKLKPMTVQEIMKEITK
jgi:hypothetical protein